MNAASDNWKMTHLGVLLFASGLFFAALTENPVVGVAGAITVTSIMYLLMAAMTEVVVAILLLK